MRAGAVERLHEQRAERARGVRGRAGDGTDHEDDPREREADDDAGDRLRRVAVDRSEDDEDEDPGGERLGEEGRAPARRRPVEERHPEASAEARATRAEHAPHEERSDGGADELCRDIRRDVAPRKAPRRCKRDGHGRIDVRAGDRPEHVDRGDDGEAEGECDEAEIRAAERLTVAEEQQRRHRPRADEDEKSGADHLGGGSPRECVLVHETSVAPAGGSPHPERPRIRAAT